MKKAKTYVYIVFKLILEYMTIIITLLGSTYIAVSSQIKQYSTETLLLWIISLLGLIAASSLSERYFKLNKIDKNVAQLICGAGKNVDEVFLTRKDMPPLEDRLGSAKSIIITGGSLARLSDEYYAFFEEKLKSGCTFEINMVRPYSAGSNLLCKNVVYETRDDDLYSKKTKDSLERFIELKKSFPENMKIFISDNVPPFGVLIINLGKTDSWIQVELYTYAVPTRERLQFTITPQNKKLYHFFVNQVNTLKMDSEEYVL